MAPENADAPLTGIEQRFVNIFLQVVLPAMDPDFDIYDQTQLEGEDQRLEDELTALLTSYYGSEVAPGSDLEEQLSAELASSIINKTGGRA